MGFAPCGCRILIFPFPALQHIENSLAASTRTHAHLQLGRSSEILIDAEMKEVDGTMRTGRILLYALDLFLFGDSLLLWLSLKERALKQAMTRDEFIQRKRKKIQILKCGIKFVSMQTKILWRPSHCLKMPI